MKRNIFPALNLIKKWEGLHKKVGNKIVAYLDPIGIPTIGWGSILHPDGRKVKLGDEISLQMADDYLAFEVAKIIPAIEGAVKVSINNNQFCALVSFCYNVGTGAFKSSTMLKRINAGDFNGAANEFSRWNKAGGKVLTGLVNRRKDEMNLFISILGIIDSAAEVEEVKNSAPVEKDWFSELLQSLIESVQEVVTPKIQATVKPDDAETGAPAKQTYSAGDGPRITKEKVEEILKANGVSLDQYCKLAIRGYFLDTYGAKGTNDRGLYDDAIIEYWGSGFYTYKANVDPNSVRKGFGFGSSKGMANLKKGVWYYQKGMHNGSVPHMAFRQADKVTVIRDGNPSYENTGWFGINIHRGGNNSPSSLGCQTIQPKDWNQFRDMAYSKLDEKNQKIFKYVLVDELDLRAGKLKV